MLWRCPRCQDINVTENDTCRSCDLPFTRAFIIKGPPGLAGADPETPDQELPVEEEDEPVSPVPATPSPDRPERALTTSKGRPSLEGEYILMGKVLVTLSTLGLMALIGWGISSWL